MPPGVYPVAWGGSELCLQEPTYVELSEGNVSELVAQREIQFADVTPERPSPIGGVAVTVRISGAEMDIHNGADVTTVETVLRVLKSC